MSALAKLKKRLPDVVSEYFNHSRTAEARRAVELTAVVKIQAAARGFLVRRRLKNLTSTAVTVQKWWRGYLGRLRGRLAKEHRDRNERKAYFNQAATTIQRHWRGFWSRKHLHNYYARRQYLEAITAKNNEIRQHLADEEQRTVALQSRLAEDEAKIAFETKISRLHHLVSTTVQPGIFNSPYTLATGTLPHVAGKPVEEHLKTSSKQQVKSRLPPLKSKISGSSRLPNKSSASAPPTLTSFATNSPGTQQLASTVISDLFNFERLTLRQTPSYDLLHQEELLEEKIRRSQILLNHPAPFIPTVVPKAPFLPVQTVRNCEKYVDPWDPTVGTRAEGFDETSRKLSPTPFQKYSKNKTFFDKNYPAEAAY